MKPLIVGVSTRAIAESAVSGGHQVLTLDYFGDSDQKQRVENYSLMRDFGSAFSAGALLEASRSLDFRQVVYISNLENHPQVVSELARGRALLGNPPSVLRPARDWRVLRRFCREQGLRAPVTWLPGEERRASSKDHWLVKPIRSGGGHQIRTWSGAALGQDSLLQAQVRGRPASACFVADGRRSVLLAVSEQLIGRRELGASAFAWCGNLLPLRLPAGERRAVLREVQRLTDQLTAFLGLRGVNGVDLILAEEAYPVLVEINPRYTASMELVEWAYGLNIFTLHLEAMGGELPVWNLAEQLVGPCFGKGIVFARRPVVVPATDDWRARGRRDIPFGGDRIGPGQPICTVLVEGTDDESCWQRLVEGARAVWQETGDKGGGEV